MNVMAQMNCGQGFLALLLIAVCCLLILVVLVQRGRGGGLAGAFGGAGGSSAFGAKTGDVFTWVTVVVAVIFLLLNVFANFAFDQSPEPVVSTPATTVPVTPGQPVPIELPPAPDGTPRQAIPIDLTPNPDGTPRQPIPIQFFPAERKGKPDDAAGADSGTEGQKPEAATATPPNASRTDDEAATEETIPDAAGAGDTAGDEGTSPSGTEPQGTEKHPEDGEPGTGGDEG